MGTWMVGAALAITAFVVVAGLRGAPVRGINRWIFLAGSILIIAGYIALSQGPATNPVSLTLAPILLVLGYVVLIPIALFRRQDDKDSAQPK